MARQGLQFAGRVGRVPQLLFVLLQFIGNVSARVLTKIPIIGALAGALVGFRKIVRPW